MKILVALDDTESSHDAVTFLNEAFGLYDLSRAALHEVMVLHVSRSVIPFAFVADPLTGGVVYPAALPSVMEAQTDIDAHEELAVKSVAAELDTDAKVVVEHGDIGRSICDAVQAHDIDLVVVGTRDRSAWSKLWHPSVSDHVIHHAGCAVLVVR